MELEEMLRLLATVYFPLWVTVVTYLFRREQILIEGEAEKVNERRRAAIHLKRIEEAREYLDLFGSVLRQWTNVRTRMVYSRMISQETKALEEILSIIEVAGKTRHRIDTLNDPVLQNLGDKLIAVAKEKEHNIIELMSIVKETKSTDMDVVSRKLAEEHKKASALISQMQSRLDELAQINP